MSTISTGVTERRPRLAIAALSVSLIGVAVLAASYALPEYPFTGPLSPVHVGIGVVAYAAFVLSLLSLVAGVGERRSIVIPVISMTLALLPGAVIAIAFALAFGGAR